MFPSGLRSYSVALANLEVWTKGFEAVYGPIRYGKDDRSGISHFDPSFTGWAYLDEGSRNMLKFACWASSPACTLTPYILETKMLYSTELRILKWMNIIHCMVTNGV
jgi:hypothetical protein